MNAAIQFRRSIGRANMRIVIREDALNGFSAVTPADMRPAPSTATAEIPFHNNVNQAAKIFHGGLKN